MAELDESFAFPLVSARLNQSVINFPTVGGAFMTTHWSLIGDFSQPELAPARAEAALTRLCRDYWPPLYRFVRQRGYNRDDARDLTQGFFVYLLETKAYSTPDRSKGRFRTFLLTILKRYLNADRSFHSRQKRGGGEELISLDSARFLELVGKTEKALATDPPLDEERLFEWNWADALVGRAIEALRAEHQSGARARIFAELRPFLTGGVGLPSREGTAARLGLSEEALRSQLCRIRARYRALLRAEVLRTVPGEREIDDELRYLCRILIAQS